MVGGIERLNAFLEKQKTQATVDCEKWVRKARQGGARARYLIESSSMGVSEVILRATKKLDADLIIMTAVTGPKQAFFLGSVTNDILRRAKRPVLVFN
jgi:nucleotide-binding universal stress UspA family protein